MEFQKFATLFLSLDPMDCSLPGSSVHGVIQPEYWSQLPFPPPDKQYWVGQKDHSDFSFKKIRAFWPTQYKYVHYPETIAKVVFFKKKQNKLFILD